MPLNLPQALRAFATRCEESPLEMDVHVKSVISGGIVSTVKVTVVGVDGDTIRMCREAASILEGLNPNLGLEKSMQKTADDLLRQACQRIDKETSYE